MGICRCCLQVLWTLNPLVEEHDCERHALKREKKVLLTLPNTHIEKKNQKRDEANWHHVNTSCGRCHYYTVVRKYKMVDFHKYSRSPSGKRVGRERELALTFRAHNHVNR